MKREEIKGKTEKECLLEEKKRWKGGKGNVREKNKTGKDGKISFM